MSLGMNVFQTRRVAARLLAAPLVAAAFSLVVGTAAPAVATSPDVAAALVSEYGGMFRAQAQDGAIPFDRAHTFFRDYPVLATMCDRSVAGGAPNAAFVSQSAAAIARYYTYLFDAHDRNHNLLVESTVTGTDGTTVEIEDAAYNSLLALDMLSLARLNLTIMRPYHALYWYEGSRAVQAAVIAATYDRRTRYFFPRAAAGRRNTSRFEALSALPLLFPASVGDNDATMIARQYLLDPTPRAPESPFDYLGGTATYGSDAAAATASLLKTTLLIDVLDARGFDEEADGFRARARERARLAIAATAGGDMLAPAALRLLAERLDAGDRTPFFDPWCTLDLFDALLRAARSMPDVELVRLSTAVDEIQRFESHATGKDAVDATRAQEAIRTVYLAISKLRDQLATGAPLPSDAYRALGGMDAEQAVGHLLDDVALVLGDCENDAAPRRGLHATATLRNESAILGGSVGVRWTLESQKGTIHVASASMIVGDAVVPLVEPGEGLVLKPGAPATLDASVVIDHGHLDTLEPLTMTLDVDDGSGTRTRFHALRTVYVEHAVEASAAFPRGRMLSGETLPIQVTLQKRMATAATIQYEWYSPTGLTLKEGRTAEYTMAAGEDSTELALNVEVPPHCRPGRFPFKLKFTADGTDIGTVSSWFFLPYQWAAIGPFPATRKPGGLPFAAGPQIDLAADYDGAEGSIGWRVVDAASYTADGDVSLRAVMPDRHRTGVAYLYTAIEATDIAPVPVFLECSAPAALFVNGTQVVESTPGAGPAYGRAPLEHGVNEFVVRVTGNASARVAFSIGDENDATSYSFNNNMSELAVGYNEMYRRSKGHDAPTAESQKLVTLRYRDPAARAVAVIGSFNGWSPDQSRMHRLDSGVWEIVLSLPPGRHEYRFLVDNRRQVTDPDNRSVEPDGFGGENSVLVVE